MILFAEAASLRVADTASFAVDPTSYSIPIKRKSSCHASTTRKIVDAKYFGGTNVNLASFDSNPT